MIVRRAGGVGGGDWLVGRVMDEAVVEALMEFLSGEDILVDMVRWVGKTRSRS